MSVSQPQPRLRYEAASTPTEADGKIAVLRDFINDAETTVGGPIWNNPSKDNFAPRASLAWDPLGDGKTVVRAGGGIFFDLLGSRELTIAGVRTPRVFNRILVFGRPRFPDILDAAAGRNPSSSMDGLDFDLNQPYARSLATQPRTATRPRNLAAPGLQRRPRHPLARPVDQRQHAVPERLDDGRFFFPAGNPRVNPAFSRIGLRRSQFNSFYQGLTLSLQTGFGDRLDVRGKYTWSRSIDEASNHTFNDFVASDQVPTVWDYRANRGLSDFDQAHVFAASFSYTVSKWSGTRLPALLGGWELHAIAQSLSGTPFAPRVGFDRARLRPAFGDVGQRPDLVSGRSADDIVLGDPARYFDSRAFALPAAGFLGNLGRAARCARPASSSSTWPYTRRSGRTNSTPSSCAAKCSTRPTIRTSRFLRAALCSPEAADASAAPAASRKPPLRRARYNSRCAGGFDGLQPARGVLLD